MSRFFVFVGGLGVCATIFLSARSLSSQLPADLHHFVQKSSICSHASAQAAPASSKLNVLHLIDEPTASSLMDRWFLRSQEAFAGQSDLIGDAPLWGPGFDGWHREMSLKENIQRRYGRADHFSAILPYFNTDQMYILGVDPKPLWAELKEVSRLGTVIVDRPHEMRNDRRITHIVSSNTTLVLAPYPAEVLEAQRWSQYALFAHQPHPVEERWFYHPIYATDGSVLKRPGQVQIAGNLEPAMYPLRRRMATLAEQGKIPGSVRQHPGYADTMSASDRKAHNISSASMDQQVREYSQHFGDAKVCIVTSSKWLYSVQKYGEAAAAGCLIIGNLPLDRRSDFSRFVVEIHNDMSDEKLIDVVNYWLSDENAEERAKRAEIGQRYFLDNFGARSYVSQVSNHIRQAKEGTRGMSLPFEFTALPDPLPNDG